jgi:dTDP-4-dehydrorhamnose reductase
MNKKNNINVVVLGADGMLGNAMYKYLNQSNIKTFGTSRKKAPEYYFFDADCFNNNIFKKLLKKFKPDYIINCIGYIRPKNESPEEFKKALMVNSVFPQKLSLACLKFGIKLIHFSTDCVFSGNDGPYTRQDIPDELNIYGLSKFLGETRELPNVTIRTSIIGRELSNNRNLLDWFLGVSEKKVNGYKNVFWNGISTITAAKIVKTIIDKNIEFKKPLIQITSNKVSKYDLLCSFKNIFKKDIIIKPFYGIKSDKTLTPSEEQKKYFSKIIPSIEKQILELKKFYER